MASTDVEIANLALLRIGQKTVTALSAASTALEERVAVAIFTEARDEFYALEDWGFARKYADLVDTTNDPDNDNFSNEYTLPTDFLEFRSIKDYSGDYEIVEGFIWTDDDECELIYTFKQTDYTKVTGVYLTAMLSLMAFRFAEGLALKAERIQRAERNWFTAYQRARVNMKRDRTQQDAREKEADIITDR